MLYCCLLVRVQPLSLAWVDLHYTDSHWASFQGPIIEFRLGYPIFYLGTSEIFPPTGCKSSLSIFHWLHLALDYVLRYSLKFHLFLSLLTPLVMAGSTTTSSIEYKRANVKPGITLLLSGLSSFNHLN